MSLEELVLRRRELWIGIEFFQLFNCSLVCDTLLQTQLIAVCNSKEMVSKRGEIDIAHKHVQVVEVVAAEFESAVVILEVGRPDNAEIINYG